MADINDGGAAFPAVAMLTSNRGMSLRDWFAGQALAGMLACPNVAAPVAKYSQWAYQHADAMLAERAK